MSHLPFFIISSIMWAELSRALEANRFPQSLALRVPQQYHFTVATELAHLILCEKRCNCGVCDACLAWHEGVHPDLLLAGTTDKAPRIEACRQLTEELTLRPVASPRRLAVVFAADTLPLGAANSLLKVVEEPPSYAVILFIHEGEGLLPTLKSRCWNLSTIHESVPEQEVMPNSEESWFAWVRNSGKISVEELEMPLGRWGSWALAEGHFHLIEPIERLRLLSQTGRLSQSMLLDYIVLVLKEGFAFEHIFDDFR